MSEKPWWTFLIRDRGNVMPDQRSTDEQLADLSSIAWRVGVKLEVLDQLPQPTTNVRPNIEFVMDRVPQLASDVGIKPPERTVEQQLEDVRQIANRVGLYDAADRLAPMLDQQSQPSP